MRKKTAKGYVPWRVDEAVNVARKAHQMAERVGARLVLSRPKLMALGLTEAQAEEVHQLLPEITEMEIT